MLFYETEGTFGEESFKVTAKSLFLLDIGSQTYTEYDPADPELIKFLMANPEALMLKKGHIHSHNNMGVFFSGTDNNELVDNSAFHNFYLSLIVNNRNEMCAKIAFKAKTETENNVTLTFLDENGKEKQKKLTNKREDEAIYVYKCDIIKSIEVVEDSFMNRFQELSDEKSKRAAQAATIKERALKGSFNVDERWKQALLFEDFRGSTDFSNRQEKRSSVIERSEKVDPRVYSMLTKLVALDPLYEGTLGGLLKKLNDEFYGEYVGENTPDTMYYDTILKKSVEFYIEAFPEDTIKMANFESVMEKCIAILETYEREFPELTNNLIESLYIELK